VKPYIPEKSGLPSMRGVGRVPDEASAAAGAMGVVPATVTVRDLFTSALFVNASVYVVVAFGVTLIVP